MTKTRRKFSPWRKFALRRQGTLWREEYQIWFLVYQAGGWLPQRSHLISFFSNISSEWKHYIALKKTIETILIWQGLLVDMLHCCKCHHHVCPGPQNHSLICPKMISLLLKHQSPYQSNICINLDQEKQRKQRGPGVYDLQSHIQCLRLPLITWRLFHG